MAFEIEYVKDISVALAAERDHYALTDGVDTWLSRVRPMEDGSAGEVAVTYAP